MLRAAVKAGTPLGREVEGIMARGALCPDDVVVSIVEERIAQPDARKGFILDGFPRTEPQAEALDNMLQRHGLALDAVIELRVDETALIRRIENRVAEMKARGEPLRPDDNAEVLHRRLTAYREQTAPLIAYYRKHRILHSLDGMAPIAAVAARIEGVLEAPATAPESTPHAAPAKVLTPAKVLVPAKTPAGRIGKKSKVRSAASSQPGSQPRPAAAKTGARTSARTGTRTSTKARVKARVSASRRKPAAVARKAATKRKAKPGPKPQSRAKPAAKGGVRVTTKGKTKAGTKAKAKVKTGTRAGKRRR
jgi:adenylate kinase